MSLASYLVEFACRTFSPQLKLMMTWDARESAVMASLEASLAEGLTLAFATNMACAVVLADPNRFDCPMIACSDGFENLTGYSKSEAKGRNLRFLNKGATMTPPMRKALCSSSETGIEFMGILPNIRKNGEPFRMLLHMASVTANSRWYMMGLQADVTDIALDLTDALHIDLLQRVAEPIFSANVDACVQLPGQKFTGQHVKKSLPGQYMAFQGKSPVKDSIDGILNDYAKVLFKHATTPSEEFPGKRASPGSTNSPYSASAEGPSRSVSTTSACSTTGLSHVQTSSSDDAGLISDIDESPPRRFHRKQSSSNQAEKKGNINANSCSDQMPTNAGVDRQPHQAQLHRSLLPKSVGSVCHPDRCTPCKYYFGASGCRHGTDCRMCHEPHLTKGPECKKHVFSCD